MYTDFDGANRESEGMQGKKGEGKKDWFNGDELVSADISPLLLVPGLFHYCKPLCFCFSLISSASSQAKFVTAESSGGVIY